MTVADESGLQSTTSDIVYNDQSTKMGEINVHLYMNYTSDNTEDNEISVAYEFQVLCTSCGDQESSGVGYWTISDDGNNWDLECIIEFSYKPNS